MALEKLQATLPYKIRGGCRGGVDKVFRVRSMRSVKTLCMRPSGKKISLKSQTGYIAPAAFYKPAPSVLFLLTQLNVKAFRPIGGRLGRKRGKNGGRKVLNTNACAIYPPSSIIYGALFVKRCTFARIYARYFHENHATIMPIVSHMLV